MRTMPEWVANITEAEKSQYIEFVDKVKGSGLQTVESHSLQSFISRFILRLGTTSAIMRLSGRNTHGIPLPFFRFKNNSMKFLISSKQIEFCRGLFNQYGTKIWREWETSALLHQDYLDLKDELEPVYATMDEAFESALFWYSALEKPGNTQSKKIIHLLVEGADAAQEWLADLSLTQSSQALIEVCSLAFHLLKN